MQHIITPMFGPRICESPACRRSPRICACSRRLHGPPSLVQCCDLVEACQCPSCGPTGCDDTTTTGTHNIQGSFTRSVEHQSCLHKFQPCPQRRLLWQQCGKPKHGAEQGWPPPRLQQLQPHTHEDGRLEQLREVPELLLHGRRLLHAGQASCDLVCHLEPMQPQAEREGADRAVKPRGQQLLQVCWHLADLTTARPRSRQRLLPQPAPQCLGLS
mmetsp:Transcript_95996/g.311387  ORF Transcript_95996/g.311387 Transcript_95996/m.311387 type:complete len:215 (+) Transcript_95996:22-666(+)